MYMGCSNMFCDMGLSTNGLEVESSNEFEGRDHCTKSRQLVDSSVVISYKIESMRLCFL